MMKTGGLFLTMLSTVLFLGGCCAKKEATPSADIPTIEVKQSIKGGEDARILPNATIFRMSGDFANNVAVTLNDDGSLAYYPAPSDITANSAPYPLGNGWYLNRQGIGPKSVFTTYTFDRYRALDVPPTQQQIMGAIIPGSSVIEIREIPVKASEALANPEICLKFLP